MGLFESFVGKGRETKKPSPESLLDRAIRLKTLTKEERGILIKNGYGRDLKDIDRARREAHRKANTH